MVITVATEDEKKVLVPEKYWDNVVITGIGMLNTIATLKNIETPNIIVNIGYAGAKDIPVGTVCRVERNEAYQVHDLPLGDIPLYGFESEVPAYKCYTATDFIESSEKEGPFLVDMELLAHTVLNCPVLSIKVVSDNMSFKDYDKALKDNYQEEVDKALDIMGMGVIIK